MIPLQPKVLRVTVEVLPTLPKSVMANTTQQELKNALIRLKHGRPKVVDKKRKISISALAEETGVADSTIHNRYPDIAAEVRNLVSTDHRLQRDEKNDMLKVEKEKNKQLRSQIE